jgi:hypothetical protein
MANMDQTDANNLLKVSLGIAAYATPTTPMKLRLINAGGTAPTATVNGTAVTGGSYADQNLTTALGTATGGSVTNSAAAINYTNMPAVTVNAVEVWDSAGTPVRHWFGSIASKTTNAGDTLSFSTSSITISLS